MNYLSLAITKLRPEAEFSFSDDDYSTIVWHKLDGNEPTKIEIESAIKEIKADQAKTVANALAAKEAAQAKLAALGLTTDDLKALGL